MIQFDPPRQARIIKSGSVLFKDDYVFVHGTDGTVAIIEIEGYILRVDSDRIQFIYEPNNAT